MTRLRRMPHKAAYDRASIDAILDAMPVAHVGHLVDGRPVVIPTLQWRIGDRVYWHGSAASRMQRQAADAPVCLTVTITDAMVLARSGLEHSVNFRSVTVFGQATLLRDPGEKAQALEAMMEGMFPGRWGQLRPMTAPEVKATAILWLPLDEASAKISSGMPDDPEADLGWPVWAGLLPIAHVTGAPEPDPRLAPGTEVPGHALRYRFGERPER
jgi:nitroimidazol reductase NimA-like FMN-containing flavoprotein (pyridoxamine 5'-phosphate oxidase superfamily)